jgi:D-alanine transaminase
MNRVFLNGEFLPLEQARIPVMDRGFLFGDGVYEVIPVYGGRLFRLEEHLGRLDRSLRAIRIEPPHDHGEWREILERLIDTGDDRDRSVYLQVTRGADSKRDHAIPPGLRPTVFAMVSPIPAPDPALQERGIGAVTREDIRWHRCDIKAVTLLAAVLLRQEAAEDGAMEAILVRDGLATEGAASNLFIVHDGVIVTPPKSPDLLPGITRDLVLELAAREGLAHREAPIAREQLEQADEVWLTSSTKEVMPVTRLDGRTLGDGRPGPVWRQMRDLYREHKEQLRANPSD